MHRKRAGEMLAKVRYQSRVWLKQLTPQSRNLKSAVICWTTASTNPIGERGSAQLLVPRELVNVLYFANTDYIRYRRVLRIKASGFWLTLTKESQERKWGVSFPLGLILETVDDWLNPMSSHNCEFSLLVLLYKPLTTRCYPVRTHFLCRRTILLLQI